MKRERRQNGRRTRRTGACGRPVAALAAMLVAVSMLAVASGARATAANGTANGAEHLLFGSQETRGANPLSFSKWAEMLSRHEWEEDRGDAGMPCRLGPDMTCRRDQWKTLVESLAGRPEREQIDAVNSFINSVEYVPDQNNWGASDYWATPREFLDRGGDCEDYAIAKYFSLRGVGFDTSRLRIVVVEDLNLGIPHAVLAVYMEDSILLLDNQLPQVVKASSIVHYRPVYSINTGAWWLHRP